ncbi:hypothetical protein ABZ442_14735 [Streptomyces triculaminicus]|uniref:hypothetical protein n=1 Tax=Streptomyces triculaminicus TaxID=2816232 RepID=UPI0033D2B8D9
MTITEPVVDSPDPWVADHIRRSGQLRRTALACVRDGQTYVLAASSRARTGG